MAEYLNERLSVEDANRIFIDWMQKDLDEPPDWSWRKILELAAYAYKRGREDEQGGDRLSQTKGGGTSG